MKSSIKIALIILVLNAQFVAAKTIKKTLQIRPGKIQESCVTLKASQSISYSFTSNAPLDFNIHYHQGKQVVYPVKLNGKKSHKANFKANLGQDYCLMWSNKTSKIVQLQFNHSGG